jgi:hypothetical protein
MIGLIIFVFIMFIGMCIKFTDIDKEIRRLRNWTALTEKEQNFIDNHQL